MTDVAKGDIQIGLDQGNALAEVDALVTRVRAKMSALDGDRAELSITGNNVGLDKAIAEAKAKSAAATREDIKFKLSADTKNVDAAADRIKARMLRLKAELDNDEIAVKANVKKAEAELFGLEAMAKRVSATKAELKVTTNGVAKALAEEEALTRASKQHEDSLLKLSKAAEKSAEIKNRAGLESAREAVRVANLAKQYKDLSNQLDKTRESFKEPTGKTLLDKLTGRNTHQNIELGIDAGSTIAKMKAIEEELKFLGRNDVVIHVKTADNDAETRLSRLGGLIGDIGSKFSKLGSAKINFGPITTSITGLITALSVLSPIVVEAVGSLTSLVGIAGAASLGAGAVGGGILGGLALNLIGVRDTVGHVTHEFTEASKAQQKYESAINHYGTKSKEAIKAHEELRSVLGHISEGTEEAAAGFNKMEDAWDKLVLPKARADFGRNLAEGVKTLQTLMPGLAKNTDQTITIISSHLDSLFAHLRQPAEAKGLIGLGRDANKFLGPALGTLERFGAGLLHIGEAGARIFAGPLGSWVKGVGRDFEQATQPGAKLDSTVTKLGHDARDVGKFFIALGKVIFDVLGGSATSGDKLVNNMTRLFDRWDSFLNSVRGKNDMSKFFEDSRQGAEAFFGILGPLIKYLFSVGAALSPAVNTVLKLAEATTNFIVGLGKLVGLKNPLAQIGAVLGAMFFVSKVQAFVTGIASAITALKTFIAVAKTGDILGAFSGAGAAASAIRGVPAVPIASRATPAVALGETAVGTSEAAAGTTAFEGGLLGLGAALTPVTLGLGALVAGTALFILTAKNTSPALEDVTKKLGKNSTAIKSFNQYWKEAGTTQSSTQAQLHEADTNLQRLSEKLDKAKKGTQEYAQAQFEYNQGLGRKVEAERKSNEEQKVSEDNAKKDILNQRHKIELAEDAFKKARKDKGPGSVEGFKKDEEAEIRALQLKAQAEKQLQESENKLSAAAANRARGFAGLPSLIGAAEQAIGKLGRTSQKAASLIATRFPNEGQVQRAAESANDAISSGVSSKVVLKIVADSSSAKQAIESLRNAANIVKHLDIIQQGGPAAVAMLSHIAGIHLSPKQARIISEGGPAAVSMARKVIGALAEVPRNTPVKVSASTSGLSAVNALREAIFGVQSKSVSVSVNTIETKSQAFGPGPTKRAEGGPVHGWEKTLGGMYDAPTLLVGEEHRPEYVISTNPAYKAANAVYLEEAADVLGYSVVPAFASGGKITPAERHQDELRYRSRSFGPGPDELYEEEVDLHNRGFTGGEHKMLSGVYYKRHRRHHKVTAAAKGKGGKGKKAPATAKPRPGAAANELQTPENYQAAGVDETQINEIVSKLGSALTTERSMLHTVRGRIDKDHKSIHFAEEGVKKAHASKSKTKGTQIAHAEAKLHEARQKLAHDEGGKHKFEHGRGTFVFEHGQYESVDAVLKNLEVAKKDKAKLELANANISHLNHSIGIDQTRLSNIQKNYKKSGDPALIQGPNGWNAVLKDRKEAIAELIKVLKGARTASKEAQHLLPSTITERVDNLTEQIETAETTSIDQSEAESIEGPGAEGPPSAEAYVKTLKLLEGPGGLQSLERAFAIAQTNNEPDNPNTPANEELPTIIDDREAAKSLEAFWENVLSTATASGAPDSTVRDIANSVTSARSTYQGLVSQIKSDEGLAAGNKLSDITGYNTAREELFKTYGGNFAPIFSSAPGVPSSAAGIAGAVGPTAKAGPTSNTTNVHVTNHFSQPPTDPHGWSNGVAWELQAAI